jgi:hypothetical protein
MSWDLVAFLIALIYIFAMIAAVLMAGFGLDATLRQFTIALRFSGLSLAAASVNTILVPFGTATGGVLSLFIWTACTALAVHSTWNLRKRRATKREWQAP